MARKKKRSTGDTSEPEIKGADNAPETKEEKQETKKGYPVKDHERDLYHAQIEMLAYDKNSGQKLSKPSIQKFSKREWPGVFKNAQAFGYTVTILYNPNQQ